MREVELLLQQALGRRGTGKEREKPRWVLPGGSEEGLYPIRTESADEVLEESEIFC